MKTRNRLVGDLGESIACKYLERKGYTIVGRNYWKPNGEIDIIAEKNENLIFIEVKTIRVTGAVTHETQDLYSAEDNLHEKKLGRLARVIRTYIKEKRFMGNWVFGAIFVELNEQGSKVRVRFIEDIVL